MLFKEKAQASRLKAGDIRRWWNYMEWSMPGFDMGMSENGVYPQL